MHAVTDALRIEELPTPTPGAGQVLVKVETSGLCHTDIHAAHGDWPVNPPLPLIPGHEFCGEVVAYGDEVTSVKEGDFVSAEMHVACGKCLQCRTGEAHICQNVKIIGVDADGAFAEYVCVPIGVARKPANLTFEEALLVRQKMGMVFQGAALFDSMTATLDRSGQEHRSAALASLRQQLNVLRRSRWLLLPVLVLLVLIYRRSPVFWIIPA